MGDTLLSMLRYICGLIDSIVYILISKLYDLFIDTANLILYSQDAMDAIGKRIGLILGIVMLFRLAVSLMSYLVSPDTISDKAKGGSKIVTNIIISLILLVTINPIFEQAYKIQIKLVQSKFVEKIFFGPQADIPNVDIAYSLYSSFLTPDPQECKDLFDPYIALNTECSNLIGSITNHKISDTFRNDILSSHKLYNVLNNYDVINYKLNGYYFFDYFMIVSTVAGVVVALMLITFCMDLATRAVKLLFLQIIAPIPIIANVDPSKGSDIFKKWMKECITTYVSLFIRLILINFAVFMMTLIQTEFHEVFSQRGPLLTVLIIIGCLMFAKQAPKLIENITGIKSEGFTLNPIKKFQEQALFGKQITGLGAAGLAGGAVLASNGATRVRGTLGDLGKTYNKFKGEGFKSGMKSLGKTTLNAFYGVGSVAAGGISATGRGTLGAIKGEKFGQIYKGSYQGAINARKSRDDRRDSEVGWFEMMESRATHAIGGSTRADYVKSANDNVSKLQSAYKSMMAAAEGADDKHDIMGTGSLSGQTFKGMKGLAKFEEELKKTSINEADFKDITDDKGNIINSASEQYLKAVAEHRKRLDDIDQMKKDRIDEIAQSDFGTVGVDAATEQAIKDGYKQMQSLTDDINAATRQIDDKISILDKKKEPSKLNGYSKGVSSQIALNEEAARAQKIDSFSANKNQK